MLFKQCKVEQWGVFLTSKIGFSLPPVSFRQPKAHKFPDSEMI